MYDFMDHPSIEIFKKIIDKVPYSPYAAKAQYKTGILLLKLGRYDEAREAFQKVGDNYPDSEWAAPAKYQLAIATSKASGGADYDSTAVVEATKKLDEFIKVHPDADISPQANAQLKELRNREAKKNFDIAEFYERQRQYKSAQVYYKIVLDRYSDTDYAKRSKNALAKLETKLKGK
jgi:outer membrane protein assembly factor BamD